MQVKLVKFLFIGAKDKREVFFHEAQKWGLIHFSGKGSRESTHPLEIQKTLSALKMLPAAAIYTPLVEGTVDRLLQLKEHCLALELELAQLKSELKDAVAFGEVPFAILGEIENASNSQHWRFYWAYAKSRIENPSLILVNSDKERNYYTALSEYPLKHPNLHEVPLHKLQRQAEAFKELSQVQGEIAQLAGQQQGLKTHLTAQINASAKDIAMQKALWTGDEAVFAAAGWVPEKEIGFLQQKVSDLKVQMVSVAQERDELPPTLLKNTTVGQMGEDLVNIYDTPSPTDKDPSLWVIAFFALFFAFIIGDGGYGLLFLGTALFVRWKYSLGQAGLRVWRIAATVSVACILWGLFTTSFFGISFAQDSFLRKCSVLQWAVEKRIPASTLQAHPEVYARAADQVMLELALWIGIVHLTISLLRYAGRNPPAWGWLLFLWSAALYTPRFLEAQTMLDDILHVPHVLFAWAPYGMGVGIVLATVLSIFKHRWLGLLEFTTVLQLFGDSLSYLRLYALALAGSMLTGALMELAGSMNLFAGALILLVGHLGNMVLSIMGGLIHGLRLNFLEWYHYSFEGGGKPYLPLRRIR